MNSSRITFLWTNLKHHFSRYTLSWRKPISHLRAGKPLSRLEILTATVMSWVVSRHILTASFAKPTPVTERSSKTSDILEQADELYDRVKYEEMYDLLVQHQEVANDEILWRLARASFEKAKLVPSKEEKIRILKSARDYVYRALQLNDSNFAAHKWASILVVEVAEYEGTKAKIEQSVVAKQHMLKAHALNPQDATTLYLLGVWCFTFADLSWHQRNLAKLLFASPPNSSFEEALNYFVKAEEVQPNFYSMNLLMLGKTCMKLNDKTTAIKYLKRAREYPSKTEEDKQAQMEAGSLLKNLGVLD